MTSELQERMQDASARNAELLLGLQETDSAPSQLYQHIQYMADLDRQILQTEKRAASLKQKTEAELQDHKKYSESTFRRFAHKASGRRERFAEKAAKEEREYFDAILEQKTADDELAYVRQLRDEAQTVRTRLEAEAHRHDQLQEELDSLYAFIFDGPTPGFPEDDQREADCHAANQLIQDIHLVLEKERHTLFLLRQVAQKLDDTSTHLSKALDLSQMDLFGGGTYISMKKRNYLEKAESCVAQIRMLQSQIQRLDPGMADLGPMDIASGRILGDVLFDNFFSDIEMHNEIKMSQGRIRDARRKCGTWVRKQEEKEKRCLGAVKGAEGGLRRAREELQRARMEAFGRLERGERIVADTWSDADMSASLAHDEALPAYSA